MNQTTHIVIFLILSACGATIIASKGDIFKWLRDGLQNLSKKNKRYIHDVSLPKDFTIKRLQVDGVSYSTVTNLFDFIRQRSEIVNNKEIRYFTECKTKHKIVYDIEGELMPYACSVYEKFETIKWIDFIYSMISCPQCAGFWIGMLWYSIGFFCGYNHFHLFIMFSYGCLVSLISYLYFKLYSFLEKK